MQRLQRLQRQPPQHPLPPSPRRLSKSPRDSLPRKKLCARIGEILPLSTLYVWVCEWFAVWHQGAGPGAS